MPAFTIGVVGRTQHLSHYNMASLGLWTLPFCSLVSISPNEDPVNLQSGLNLSDVLVALHRFPSSHAPVFLGWHLNGEGPLPPPAATLTTARRQGPPVGRRARGTRTTILAYVQKTLHLGAWLLATQDGESEYARDERSGLSPLPVALQLCRGADPSPNTRPARSALSQHAATLPALSSASHSIAPQTASACPGTFQHFFGASDQFGNMPQGRHTGIILE